MTTEFNGSVPAGTPAAVESSPATIQPQAESERAVPQSQFDKAAGAIRESAYQKGRADALAERQPQQPTYSQPPVQQQAPQAPAQQNLGNFGGMQQVNQDEIRRLIAEETRKTQLQQAQDQQEAQWKQTVSSFYQRIAASKADYPDIEDKVVKLNLASAPEIVFLANSLENTGDFINDLYANPHKLGNIVNLARIPGLSHLAVEEAQKIANSLKANKQAKGERTANDPLSHVNPSITGTDNGNLSQDDYRNMPELRG